MNGDLPLQPVSASYDAQDRLEADAYIGGLSIRQHFACEMMKALIPSHPLSSRSDVVRQMDSLAQIARELADALLRALP